MRQQTNLYSRSPTRIVPQHTQGDPGLGHHPEVRARHEPLKTIIVLGIALVVEGIRRKLPVSGVVFDVWSLAEDVVPVLARRRQDWSGLFKTNRRRETASVHQRDTNGWARSGSWSVLRENPGQDAMSCWS